MPRRRKGRIYTLATIGAGICLAAVPPLSPSGAGSYQYTLPTYLNLLGRGSVQNPREMYPQPVSGLPLSFLISASDTHADAAWRHIALRPKAAFMQIPSPKRRCGAIFASEPMRSPHSWLAYLPKVSEQKIDAVWAKTHRSGFNPDAQLGGLGSEPPVKRPVGTRRGLWGALSVENASPAAQLGAAVNKKKKKVLILMSDTGGGHRASAQALESAFEQLFPGKLEVATVDIWTDFAPWPYNRFVPGYAYMAKNPSYWKLMWEYGKFPPAKFATEQVANIICHERFKQCIEAQQPDIIISVHPLCQDLPLRVLNTIGNGRRQIPFVTVVTDLGGAHPTWFHREVDICFVPSDPIRRMALQHGLQPDQIRQHGLPIRSGFWGCPTEKGPLRKQLGLAQARTALIVGGGDGVGNLVDTTSSLARSLARIDKAKSQIIVICGKNENIKNTLSKRKWPENVHVVVKGFVNNMDAWMGASDCIITKAGPGTIAEATTRGLPVMLFNYLPGQEEGNIPLVIDGGFGDYRKEPLAIAEVVSGWLHSDEVLGRMSKKSSEAGRPAATTEIAREIGELIFGNWQLPSRKDTEDKFHDLMRKLVDPLST